MIFKVKRAQSTIEYLGLFVIVIGLFVVFLMGGNGSSGMKKILSDYHVAMVEKIALDKQER